jgi:hypothetical protein
MRTIEFSTSDGAESDDRLLREFLTAVLVAIDSAPAILRQLRRLLDAERSAAAYDFRTNSIADRFVSYLRPLIQDALTHTLGAADGRLAAIRKFYLEPQESYTAEELAAIWRITLDDVLLIFHDALASSEAAARSHFRVTWADALSATTSFQIFRAVEVERAPGTDFDRVHSDRWRTVSMLIHLPRFVVTTLRTSTPMLTSPSLVSIVERFVYQMCEAEGLLRECMARKR